MSSEDIPFNKQLRQATREIHSISDALVNAKLAFALSSCTVWAEGLLVFYEVFRYLEESMERHKKGLLGQMFVPGMARTEAFEKDLAFYLGKDWKKTYVVRPAVVKYISHLQDLEEKDPNMLIAYVYHLYMGLLSGGQILKKKRSVENKLSFSSKTTLDGDYVVDFGSLNIYNLKCAIVKNVNSIAESLDPASKENLLEESKKVFLLNNEIIGTIKGSKEVLIKKSIVVLSIIGFLIFMYYIFTSH